MSIECGECERDARSGHDPSCSRYKQSHPFRDPNCEGCDHAAATIARLQREAEGLRREYADCIEASAKQALTIQRLTRERDEARRVGDWVESLLDTLEAIAKLDASAYTLSIAKSVAINAINSYRAAHPDSETQG